VAVSCAAVLAVYTAGYARTRSAASQFEVQAERRTSAPGQPRPPSPSPEFRPVEHEDPGVSSRVASVAPQLAGEAPVRPEPTTVAAVPEAVAAPAPVEAAAPALTPAPVAPPPPTAAVEVAVPVAKHVAEVAPAAPAAPAPPPAPKWKDGTYTGWGTSRHGDIEAAVVIEGGRITSAVITQCLTRYSCSVIDMLPPQVTQRQSPDVDVVSRATQSADAFYYAVVEALGKAK